MKSWFWVHFTLRSVFEFRNFTNRARKCTAAFNHRGIKVTTTHSYAIDYKYIWACVECAQEYKRHSKSIDLSKQCCGSCKGKLVQIKPAARATNGPTEYQAFVKKVFKQVKQDNVHMKHGEIMETIGRMYRESKAKSSDSTPGVETEQKSRTKVESLIQEMGILVIEDD
jgi:hypothetical protein